MLIVKHVNRREDLKKYNSWKKEVKFTNKEFCFKKFIRLF